MKKTLLFMLLCFICMAAYSQTFRWSGTVTLDSSSADTIVVWADNFRNQPWSLDVDYTSLSGNIRFAIIASNWDNGAFSYLAYSGVTFPVTYNPTLDAYYDQNGVVHATDSYEDSKILHAKFGIMLIKTGIVTGPFKYRLKQ